MSETNWTANVEKEPFRRLLPLAARPGDVLADAFADGKAGSLPDGRTTGIGLALTGTALGVPLAWFFSLFWKGKVFDAASRSIVNRVLPWDMTAIRAEVGHGASVTDGKPCIVIDYSPVPLVGRFVRDELRVIEPGTRLGQMVVGGVPVMRFALVEHGDAA